MGKALARGLVRSGSSELTVLEKFPSQGDLPEGVTYWTSNETAKVTALGPWSELDTVILCTKPQNLSTAASQWGPCFFPEDGKSFPLVISLLAGTTTQSIRESFGNNSIPVVRAMPNIAATVDCSATAVCSAANTPEHHVDRAKEIFDCVGKTWVVTEDLLDAVTGLSGSGPAYIYMVIEALSDGGVKMGMPRKLSLELATQTVLGAAKLVQETGEHPAVLRDQVTTPGGTTICAIHELERHGLRPMLISAVVTATRRSSKLARLKKATANRN